MKRPGGWTARLRRLLLRLLFWGGALLALVFFVLVLYLRGERSREHVRTYLQSELSARLERPVTIGAVDFTLLPTVFEARKVTVAGPASDTGTADGTAEVPPVLTIERLRLRSKPERLWKRDWSLDRVELHRPVLHLSVDDEGRLNLPQWQSDGDGELQLGALVVRQGRFRFDQLRLDLDFAAEELRLNLLRQAPGELRGQLQAGAVQLDLPGARMPLPVSLQTDLRLSRELLELTDLRLRSQPAQQDDVDLEDEATSWSAEGHGRFEVRTGDGLLSFDTSGDAALLDRLGYLADIEGPLETRGAIFHRRGEGWSYRGQAESPHLRLADWWLARAAGEITVADGALRIDITDGSYADGRVSGHIGLEYAALENPLTLDLSVEDMGLEHFLQLRELPIRGVDARVQGRLVLTSEQGSRSRMDGGGQFFLQPARADAESETLQLIGSLPLVIDAGVARFQGVDLATDRQRIFGQGQYDTRRNALELDFRLRSEDVRELAPVLAVLWPDGEAPSWFPRTGHGGVDGHVWLAPDGVEMDGVRPFTQSVWAQSVGAHQAGSGATATAVTPPSVGEKGRGMRLQQLDLDLDLEDVTAPDLSAERLEGDVRLSRWALERLFLQLREGDGALLAEGWFHLDVPPTLAAADPSQRLHLTFDAVDWPLRRVGYWQRLSVPLDGALTGRMVLEGPQDDLVGRLDARSSPATAYGQPLRAVDAELQWDRRRLQFERLLLSAPAGEARVEGDLIFAEGALDLEVETDVLRLETPPMNLVFGERLAGGLRFTGDIGGRLEAPTLHGQLETRELSVLGHAVGAPGQTWQATVDWDGDRFDASGDLGLVQFEGGGRLHREQTDLRFDLDSDRLGRIVELLSGLPTARLEGHLAGELKVDRAAADSGPPVFELRLHELEGEYRRLRFAAEEPLEVAAQGDQVEIRSLYLRESADEEAGPARPGELRLQGSLQLQEGIPIDLDVSSRLSTRWLRLFTSELDLPGQFELSARLHGPAASPRVEGQGRVRLDDFVWPLSPQTVEGLRADFTLREDAVQLDRLRARIGGGTLSMSGEVQLPRDALTQRDAGEFDYRFNAEARDVKLLYPEGWHQQGDANLTLVKTSQGRQISGEVQLAEMRFQDSLGLSMAEAARRVVVPQRIQIVRTQDWLTSTSLNIDIDGPEALRIRNQEADLRGDVQLTLGGDLARPVLTGKIELEQGGNLVYAGNDYQIERGLLTFTDPQRMEPTIDLLARARVRQYRVALNVSGTLERLDARVSSDPPLPDLDVIRLITSGRAQEEELDAETLLYGQATSAVTERVSSLFGFDTLRIDPLLQGSDAVSTVRVTVGKRLSKDWFLTYSRDPSTTEEDILEAEWQVTPDMTLVFTQNGDGSFSVDARWEKRF